ncbi:MAG: two-component system NarL family sensor kinase [Crocinitomix sp.]|jgi:two-component system NarL family sensor kinase
MKLLCAILLCIPYILFAQGELQESISKFNRSNSLIDKAILADDISWKLKDINPDSSLFYAEEALKFSIESGQKEIEAYSLAGIGNYHKRKENYTIALDFYLKSLSVRKEFGDLKILAGGYNQLGILYKQQEKYDSAAFYFSIGISIVRQTEFRDILLKLYDGYAMTLYHLGEAESALAYLDSTFVLAEQIDNALTIAKSIQNKGVINQYLGHNRLALKFYEESGKYYQSLGNINGQIEVMINQASVFLTIGKRQEAERLLLNAEKQSANLGFEDNLFIIYMDLAQLYKSSDLAERKTYLEKAYDNAIIYDKVPAQIESGIEIGMLAISTGEIDEAYDKIVEIKGLENNLTKKSLFNLYLLESEYWEAVYDYEQALSYSRKALSLKDSLHRNLNDLQDMSALLENERFEKGIAIEQLRTSQAEKLGIQAKLSRDRIIIWALVVGVILLTLLFFGKRKRLKIEHDKKLQEERFKSELKQKANEADLLFLEESLNLETNIRKKIGRDLHDHLGSKLAVIQIRLDSMAKHIIGRAKEKDQLNDVITLVEKSCKDVRVIAHDLISHDFAKDSLDKSFNNHCKSISDSGRLRINYALIGDPYPVSINMKKHIYATVTLLIDNIIQHAKAKNANLQLFYHDDCMNIELDDDGIGFNPEIKYSNSGVGIDNAMNRIEKINGTIEIDGKENHGTFISISIPINNE